jgi:hypothetical protein
MLRRSSAAVATSREGHSSKRATIMEHFGALFDIDDAENKLVTPP